MVRGRVSGERSPPFGNKITHGDPVWRHCEKCDKYFDIKTGEEIQVEVMSFQEMMEKYGHICEEK